jgi:hypothetical protein
MHSSILRQIWLNFPDTVFGIFSYPAHLFSDFQLFRPDHHWRDLISRNAHLVHQNWYCIGFTLLLNEPVTPYRITQTDVERKSPLVSVGNPLMLSELLRSVKKYKVFKTDNHYIITVKMQILYKAMWKKNFYTVLHPQSTVQQTTC